MPDFPPLFDGRAVADDPFELAIRAAMQGCDAGLLLYRPADTDGSAALVLAPEVPLAEAAAMILVAGNGFADALGVLAPAEIAVHLEWPGRFRVEGARCGGLRAAAPRCAGHDVPGWLVIGLSVPLTGTADTEPGEHPDRTDLAAEGIAVLWDDLLGAWARHTLSWIARWQDEGMAPVHRDWSARAWGTHQAMSVATPTGAATGTFQGLDERGGILLKGEGGTVLVPLTETFERR